MFRKGNAPFTIGTVAKEHGNGITDRVISRPRRSGSDQFLKRSFRERPETRSEKFDPDRHRNQVVIVRNSGD